MIAALPIRQRRATTKDELKELVRAWAAAVKVSPRRVQIQEMRRKWASCSSTGTLTFSADLLAEPMEFQEYVIVHELLHLIAPNHGRVFRALLRVYLPEWRAEDASHCGFARLTTSESG